MRFLDLGVAALVGLSTIVIIYVWSPSGSDSAARHLAEEARLRDGLLAVFSQHGLLWFQQSSPNDICLALAALSNSSVRFTGYVGSVGCAGGESHGEVWASLTSTILSRTVTLVAWAIG